MSNGSSSGLVGRTLGHYRIVEPLGAGGMGEVFRAHDEKLDRDVALKVLPAGALNDEESRKRFQREANALSRLSHPHIATIHDFDTAEGVDFLVMELVRGPSLRDELEEKGALAEKTVVRLGAQLAHGLQAAHEQGIVHRDLKPANLQLTPDGLLKILDFGLARLLPKEPAPGEETAPTQTAVRQVAGTLPYMSPEQLRGRGVDARTDLYAAGAVLYEMATGRRLFSKASSAELTEAILNEDPTPPREVNERVSPGLEAVILKALDKDPELRHQTAKDLLVDLERLQLRPDSHSSGSGPGHRSTTGHPVDGSPVATASLPRGRRWKRGLALVASGAVLVALVVGVAGLVRPPQPPRITGTQPLATFKAQSGGGQYAATDGDRVYYVTAEAGQVVLNQVASSGGEVIATPLPFRDTAFILSDIPGQSALLMAGSPAGFSPNVVGDEGWPLWRVPVPAGAPQRIGDLEARSADVSPDGRWLALSRGGSLIVASIDGSGARVLADREAAGIRWAPDGSRLRFCALGPGEEEEWIWEIAATGGAPRPLWPGHMGEWLGDGGHYVFDRPPSHDLFLATESWWTRWWPGRPQPLTSGSLSYGVFGSSRDGRRIFATFSQHSSSRGTLMRYNPEKEAFEPALGGESAIFAEPSPDGEWLAWVRYPDGTLWRSRPDGSDRLQLTSPPAEAGLPRWSHDGRRIAFYSHSGPGAEGLEIRVVAADGSGGELIARPEAPGESYKDACWLPDGSLLFCRDMPASGLLRGDMTSGLLRFDPRTRRLEDVPGAASLRYARCSSQGDVLALGTSWKLRRSGSTEWRDQELPGNGYQSWTRDGQSICALNRGLQIQCLRLDTGQVDLVANASGLALAGLPWMGLDAEDRPLVTVIPERTRTLYALDWEAP